MSNEHLNWALRYPTDRPVDKAILLALADQVRKDGRWAIRLRELSQQIGVSRNTIRKSLDRLAANGILAFRAEVYRGKAQGAHTLFLLRNDDEREVARAHGFSFSREALARKDDSRSMLSTGDSAAKVTHLGQVCGPTLGQKADPQRNTQKTNPIKDPVLVLEVADRDAGQSREAMVLWEHFVARYPRDPMDPLEAAKKVFFALPIADQRAAVKGLKRYLQMRSERKFDGRLVFRKRWLSERRWEGITDADADIASEIGVRVYEGTPECEAWTRTLKKEGRRWVASQTDQEGRSYCMKRTRLPQQG